MGNYVAIFNLGEAPHFIDAHVLPVLQLKPKTFKLLYALVKSMCQEIHWITLHCWDLNCECQAKGGRPLPLHISNLHYCLNISCRRVKKPTRWSHSLKCFSHFSSTSFHLVSLPARAWNLKTEGLLWISDCVCHWITLHHSTATSS